MRWLHRDQVALLPTPICHCKEKKKSPSAQTHSHKVGPGKKGQWFYSGETLGKEQSASSTCVCHISDKLIAFLALWCHLRSRMQQHTHLHTHTAAILVFPSTWHQAATLYEVERNTCLTNIWVFIAAVPLQLRTHHFQLHGSVRLLTVLQKGLWVLQITEILDFRILATNT